MFNLNWGLISGGAALVLAFVTSLLLGHTNVMVASLRAGIFAAVFFGLGGGVSALIKIFIPELLTPDSGSGAADNVFSAGASGPRVNITVDDDISNPALPDTGNGPSDPSDVGNFSDLISGSIRAMQDIDQNPATSYTNNDRIEEFAPSFDEGKAGDLGDFSMDFGVFVSDEEGMGFTDSGLDSFSFETGASGTMEDAPPPERKVSMNKPTEFKGDFDPKEIAAGIRTVLQKDKNG